MVSSDDRQHWIYCKGCDWHGYVHRNVLTVIPSITFTVGEYESEYCPECQYDKVKSLLLEKYPEMYSYLRERD